MGANAAKRSDDGEKDGPVRAKSNKSVEASLGLDAAKTMMKVEEEYQVKIDTEKGRLGLELHPDADGLWVDRVPFGLVFEWNRKHPAKAVKPGMLITEVNDETEPAEMMSEIKAALILNLVVQKVKVRGKAPRISGSSSMARPSGMSTASLSSSGFSSLGSLSAPSFLAARPRQMPHCMHKITTDSVRTILQIAGASPDQLSFYDELTAAVLSAAIMGSSSRRLTVSSNLRTLELSVEGAAEILTGQLKHFLTRAGVPTKNLEEFEMAREEMKAEVGAVWCRFKNLGAHRPDALHAYMAPEVDLGMSLSVQIDWILADLLMPSLPIQDAIHAYASSELSNPCTYSCSVFPKEAERSLVYVATKEWLPAKSLQSCLLCLRAAGFLKPPGTALKYLAACDPLSYGTQVCMGPRGVTRGILHVGEIARSNTADLAESLQCEVSPGLQEVNKLLGVNDQQLDFLDLEVSKHGWGVTCGYGSAWSLTFHD
mmetsp:Transcript_3619/g.9130  ORF Transcript_3619/g.9130 Transcript_3619/m.9130 type:complete len:485 (+) Transcript_3619:95-1549(+)